MISRDLAGGDGLIAVEGGLSADGTAGRDHDLDFTLSINALFETNLKLRVDVTRPYSDNQNDFEVEIAYDPEIRADRLTMERPASVGREDQPVRAKPFRSEQSVQLTHIFGRISHLPRTLDLVTRYSDGGFATDVRSIERACEALRGRGLSVIYQALKAAVRLPWDAEDITIWDLAGNVLSVPPRERVRMLVQPSLAAQLADHGLLLLAETPTSYVLLAERRLYP